jgi:hypothetical protein
MHTTITWTWLRNVAAVLVSAVLGLGAAYAYHELDADDTTPRAILRSGRGALAIALAGRIGIAANDSAATSAPAEIPDTSDPPAPPAPSARSAVASFLDLEIEQDFARSYGLLSAADRAGATSRAGWSTAHAELPQVVAYRVDGVAEHGDRADVFVDLDLKPQLSPVTGLVPAHAVATFAAVAEDGGWRVAYGNRVLTPVYASDATAPAAVRAWGRAKQHCRAAEEFDGGLLGAVSRARSLCHSRGAVMTGPPHALPDTSADQPFLAAFGAAVHDWARVVRVTAPVRMGVVVAPVGERWLVIGVLQASSESS